MIDNVIYTLEIDIEEVYNKLSVLDRMEFIRKHVSDYYSLDEMAKLCYENEIADFVTTNIDKVENKVIQNEVFDRDIEIHNW